MKQFPSRAAISACEGSSFIRNTSVRAMVRGGVRGCGPGEQLWVWCFALGTFSHDLSESNRQPSDHNSIDVWVLSGSSFIINNKLCFVGIMTREPGLISRVWIYDVSSEFILMSSTPGTYLLLLSSRVLDDRIPGLTLGCPVL